MGFCDSLIFQASGTSNMCYLTTNRRGLSSIAVFVVFVILTIILYSIMKNPMILYIMLPSAIALAWATYYWDLATKVMFLLFPGAAVAAQIGTTAESMMEPSYV
jgi:hypothetical protein